ncbi:MAG: acyl-CoA dehydrogenase family protein [Deltaproteobacteria bacterium]|nr:acyl-CoA dehydrogenase family protein [Deltaproteobacteria bacterium]
MQLVLTEDQELLAKTARDFVAEKSPVARMRALRDSNDATGFSKALWKEMAELGWVGIPFAEIHGGAEMGMAELAVVMEALGRTLAPEPFLSTVLLAGQTLALGGSEALQAEWTPKIVEGDAIVALASDEARSRWNLCHVETRADAEGDGYRLTGEKIQVLDGHVADLLLVSARTSGAVDDAAGVTIFAVRPDAAGVTIVRQNRIDSRNAALVRLDGVEVAAADVIGAVGEGAPILEAAAARATVGLCAEMVGSMQEAFDRTLDYMRQRKQFEVPIGSFQALKHRAAREFIAIELSRTAVMAAARAIDAADDEAAALVSLAKAQCSEAAILVANESVQMHGGIGVRRARHRLLPEARPCRRAEPRGRCLPPAALGGVPGLLMQQPRARE